MNRFYSNLFLFSKVVISLCFFCWTNTSLSQEKEKPNYGQVHGNFEMNIQYYNEDSLIGAKQPPEKMLMSGFANVIYTNGNFEAGIRYESYLNALQGFPTAYKGNGIPFKYVSFHKDNLSMTAGNFYEQFGSGMILRAYESRGLGYDNAFEGFRASYKPINGVVLKGLIGKQRKYFTTSEGIVRGVDGEINISELSDSLADMKTKIILGGSFVSKFQADQNSQFVLPENVGSWAGRMNIINGGINFYTEYVYKINDPSADNGFIYKPGDALLTQISYSTKGFGISLSGKRNDNMSFRSERDAALTDVLINYIPTLTKQHTYNLLATLYPYATQPNGEVGYQAEANYQFKKESFLGGKYGTSLLVNYSEVRNLDTIRLNDETTNRIGYTSDYFGFNGQVYFKELYAEITKKFSKKVKGTFAYANQIFNIEVIQGKPGKPTIYSNTAIIDITYKINLKHAIRTELQALLTKQDKQDWATALIEYTFSPHWFVAVMDQYNYGNKKTQERVHYYNGSVGYVNKGNRFMVTYGRQRAGIFCVGGVCRNVPAANGLIFTVTSSF
ncbi:MAG: hypothetical protein HUU48_01540 [Flavobacteriales bacterium]|nr:hypothetical protein [Flavobacteriales bacterium]